MAIGCGAKCAKAMLIVFNIIFWLSGCALLGIGIWLRIDKNILTIFELFELDGEDPMLDYAAYVLIAVGAFVFLVGFLGCCGAIKENKCCLGLYIFFLVIVMAAELAAGILALVYKDKIMDIAEKGLVKELKADNIYNFEEGKTVFTTFGAAISLSQIKFECCGITNYTDYIESNFTANHKAEVFSKFPWTCCAMKEGTDPTKTPDYEKIQDVDKCSAMDADFMNTKGCIVGLKEYFEEKAIIMIGIGIGIACLEIFGFLFAVCLCRNTSEDDE